MLSYFLQCVAGFIWPVTSLASGQGKIKYDEDDDEIIIAAAASMQSELKLYNFITNYNDLEHSEP